MKESKFTKAISFLLATVLVVSSAFAIINAASPYSTVSTTYDCPKSLCFKNLMISGPYGDPSETIDTAVPYLGGDTYENIYNTHFGLADKILEYHLYLVYCPNYDYDDSSLLRHTMTLMFCGHGYTTKSYTQHNSAYHYANKVCDHATDIRGSKIYGLTQHLCGENAYMTETTMEDIAMDYQSEIGCGKETAVLEEHTWGYGEWYEAEYGRHARSKYCTDCGYSVTVYDNHSYTVGDWESSSDIQHKRISTCSVCNGTSTEYADHEFTYGSWENSSDTQHKRTATCSTCGYSKIEYASHNLTTSEGIYYGEDTDENYETYPGYDYHRYDSICSDCDYTSSEYEEHDMYIDIAWYDYDAKYHKQITRCHKCTFGVSTYRYHNYPKELYTYVSLNETTHSITKYCDTCTRTEDGGTASHNFVAGEWTAFDSTDENADIYDCNTYHKRSLTCTDCGYMKYEYVEHNMQIDGYTSLNADRHSCTPKCSDCTYSYNLNEPHTFNSDDYRYEVIDKDRHKFIKPCEKCDYAYEINEYHEDSDSDCYCDDCGYLMTKFSVTVPTTMVLTMGTDGEVYASSDVVIVNNSTAAVSVKKADVNSRNGWNIVPYSTNMAKEKVDSKKIGFKMNGIQSDSSGKTDSLSYDNGWIIEKDKSSPVVYDAVVSATSVPIDEQVIEIVFIVDWKEK